MQSDRRLRVLIADDTEDIRTLLRLTLAKDGRFEIVGEAGNGADAISLVAETKPDAVVLDLAMPVMDGLQALPAIRGLIPDGKIVVLSGFNASQMARDAISLGADDYLEKGTAFSRLVGMLLEPGRAEPTTAPVPRPKPDQETLVRNAIAATTSTATLDEAFVAFCDIAVEAISFERASFWVINDDGVCECCAVRDDEEDRLEVGTKLELVGRGRRILSGRPVLEADTASESGDTTNRVVREQGIRSYLGVPLVVGGATKAFISFASSRPHAFSGEDIPIALALGREVASTFHLLFLLQRERAVGLRLKEADAMKNDLVGIVAHDLRSPMTVIGGYAQYMRESWSTLDETQKLEFLDAISRNVDNVAQLVEDMLEVASLEAGHLKCEMQPFDLGDVVRGTVAEIAVANTRRTCSLTVPGDLPLAFGDVRRQRQILANLLSNAMKFSPPSSPVELVVGVDGSCAAVSVRDEGDGIDVDQVPLIFEKFYRIPNSGRRAPGNGLGLYICRLLVEAQGGRIWAESTPGIGSTFTYTVRVTDELPSVTHPSSAAA